MLLSRQGISLLIWTVVFTVAIPAIIICRFLAARIKKRALRPDDYMIVGAYVGADIPLPLVDALLVKTPDWHARFRMLYVVGHR